MVHTAAVVIRAISTRDTVCDRYHVANNDVEKPAMAADLAGTSGTVASSHSIASPSDVNM